MPAVLSIVSDGVKSSQFRLSASIASGLICLCRLRAGVRLHSLIRAQEPSALAAQDSVQSHTRSRRPGSRRTSPAKTHYATSFMKSHTKRPTTKERTTAPRPSSSKSNCPEIASFPFQDKPHSTHSSIIACEASCPAAALLPSYLSSSKSPRSCRRRCGQCGSLLLSLAC